MSRSILVIKIPCPSYQMSNAIEYAVIECTPMYSAADVKVGKTRHSDAVMISFLNSGKDRFMGDDKSCAAEVSVWWTIPVCRKGGF